MKFIRSHYKGILFASFIGILSQTLSMYLPSAFNGVLIALILGMLIGNFIRLPDSYQDGIGFSGGKLLEFSILFLAFSINYTSMANLGTKSFTLIIITVFLMMILTYLLSKKLNCPGSTGWLIGFGTAICGSSAIAALAPGVSKNKDDILIAMAVVNLYGLLGMVALPMILPFFELNVTQSGLMIGGTLHSVGNVAGAGYALSEETGAYSITIKLARVAMLTPALIFFNYLVNRHEMKGIRQFLKLPWYLWGFIIITVMGSWIEFPDMLLQFMDEAGKIILIISMAAIGMKVRLISIFKSGKNGLIFGAVIFAVQIIVIGLLIAIMMR